MQTFIMLFGSTSNSVCMDTTFKFNFQDYWKLNCCDTLVFPRYYELRHEISNNVVCATSKAADLPVHMRSLIRAFARRLNIL